MSGTPRKKRASTPRVQIVHQQKPFWTSLPSWLTLVLALCINFISVGYTYATMEAKIDRNASEILRNEREDRERGDRFRESLNLINNQIANMGQLRTDVEVMKNSLNSISETLRRLEARFDNAAPVHLKKPAFSLPPNP